MSTDRMIKQVSYGSLLDLEGFFLKKVLHETQIKYASTYILIRW
jgi:hypothetical protein